MKLVLYFLLPVFLLAETSVFPSNNTLDITPNLSNDGSIIEQEKKESVQSDKLEKEIKNLIYNGDNIENNQIDSDTDNSSGINNNSITTKNVYLNLLNAPNDVLYVNQILPLEFKLLIFGDYSSIKTEFITENSSVEILNPKENWILEPDSSLKNTFYFQIKSSNYSIPKLRVYVDTKEGEFIENTDFLRGQAVSLDRKGRYSQVVAKDLKILDTKITSYDSEQNLAVFQLSSKVGNLFDFHLDKYSQQGIESKNGNYKESTAFYYVIVPKSLGIISFDYFNTEQAKYVELQVDNIPNDDRVSTQSDIKPKNNLQFYKISIIVFFLIVFVGLYIYKRKLFMLAPCVILLIVLFYILLAKTEVAIKTGAQVRIQPTFNSTIILNVTEPIIAKVLADKRGYYKILLDDDRIGWVKKDEIQN